MRENKITALYQRISKDDGEDNVSNSIKIQKAQLEEYAKSHGFKNIVSFVDDTRISELYQYRDQAKEAIELRRAAMVLII